MVGCNIQTCSDASKHSYQVSHKTGTYKNLRLQNIIIYEQDIEIL